jgi:hypothetical protein
MPATWTTHEAISLSSSCGRDVRLELNLEDSGGPMLNSYKKSHFVLIEGVF